MARGVAALGVMAPGVAALSGAALRRAALRRAALGGAALRRAALGVMALGVLGACGAPAHQPSPPGVDLVVVGPVTSFERIEVSTADRTVILSGPDAAAVAPLTSARTFSATGPLSDYGLDHPLAVLRYVRAGSVAASVAIGAPNFDGHGYYAMRAGDPRVALVLTASVAPALRRVGIVPAQPS